MPTDPSTSTHHDEPDLPAGVAWQVRADAPVARAERPRPTSTGGGGLDVAAWRRWRHDLDGIRAAVAPFSVPAPVAEASRRPWLERVAIGRVVDAAMAGHASIPSSILVSGALDAAGFGTIGQLAGLPVSRVNDRVRRWAPVRPADDDLRLGVVGTIAESLLRTDASPGEVDLRSAPARSGDDADLVQAIVAATRDAVLAYARHVEDLAVRARRSVGRSAVEYVAV